MHHSFYFPGMLIGPYLEFQAYRSLVDGSVFKSVERKDNAIALRQG
jgi:lysophospholipid acyltransferase